MSPADVASRQPAGERPFARRSAAERRRSSCRSSPSSRWACWSGGWPTSCCWPSAPMLVAVLLHALAGPLGGRLRPATAAGPLRSPSPDSTAAIGGTLWLFGQQIALQVAGPRRAPATRLDRACRRRSPARRSAPMSSTTCSGCGTPTAWSWRDRLSPGAGFGQRRGRRGDRAVRGPLPGFPSRAPTFAALLQLVPLAGARPGPPRSWRACGGRPATAGCWASWPPCCWSAAPSAWDCGGPACPRRWPSASWPASASSSRWSGRWRPPCPG